MNKNDENLVRIMIEAAEEALSFVAGKSRRDLDENRQLQLSLARSVEIVGRPAGKVSDECQSELRSVPWSNIVAASDYLSNTYFYVNLDTIWKTVTDELPPLITELKKALPPNSIK